MKEQEIQENMNKSIEATQRNFNTIRTGRANASLLDRISVEYYGAETPIKSLATISTVDSQTIAIQPFDISCLQAIEKSISMSDLGITPNNDGKVIRIKVALRNIRRDAVDKEKKDEKDGLISIDESRDNQSEIQKITDKYIALIETKLSEKEKEILKV